ncbi:hypothetical protein [Povalibacter sp.]|uniref:hypothetical protein n=1 Tax=Povalibacter sp. TaxID=1962978 RepID=UPI002D1F9AC9|nr:hypothetical protein [Povalibacter sp.]
MRARKFESYVLVSMILLAPSAVLAETAPAQGPTTRAATELHLAQVHPASRSTQAMPRVESLQLAGLSPTAEARAATLDEVQPASHSTTKDLLALILVGAMLVAYQLFRKHRLLRQQPFSL